MTPDVADEILAAIVAQCVDDLKRGPGTTADQQRNYRSAASWLDEARLLEKVCTAHNLDYEAALDSFLEHESRPKHQQPKVTRLKLKRQDNPLHITQHRLMLAA